MHKVSGQNNDLSLAEGYADMILAVLTTAKDGIDQSFGHDRLPRWWAATARPTALVLMQQHLALASHANSDRRDSRRTRCGPCWFLGCRGR